ncbi:hypothetical protein PENNAL_c0001G00388 [Penicillium nalgiovense]|uniref:Uncharacterized protein n=1 Tax=Penicillium nalgiovense TaxID=60175 RepID=A0A1V6Z9X1_PENNA|nr:hypothetical protein PENNAL_c0001G00388 [Penicillium nalgiovense]
MVKSIAGDKTIDEVNLEKKGDINALQRYRFAMYWNKHRTRPPFTSRQLMDPIL